MDNHEPIRHPMLSQDHLWYSLFCWTQLTHDLNNLSPSEKGNHSKNTSQNSIQKQRNSWIFKPYFLPSNVNLKSNWLKAGTWRNLICKHIFFFETWSRRKLFLQVYHIFIHVYSVKTWKLFFTHVESLLSKTFWKKMYLNKYFAYKQNFKPSLLWWIFKLQSK